MTAPADPGVCRAVSRLGEPVTVYVAGSAAVVRSSQSYMICTQHPDHRGDHSACDGQGHLLASWPRRKPERYWHPEDCAGCAHHRQAKVVWQ